MKKVFLIGNHDIVIYNFRHELIKRLLHEKYEVGIVLPYGEKVKLLKEEGCRFFPTEIDRRGTNIIKDFKLLLTYVKILRIEKPDVILTYTIKPNIYGGLAARIRKVPYVANITGMGSAIEKKGILQKFTLLLYRMALKKVNCTYFQNMENMKFFINNKVCKENYSLLPGSGVNLETNEFQEFPPDGVNRFAFVGRVMKEKGIEEYLYAAKKLKAFYKNTEFHICGFCEENYLDILKEMEADNIIIYHGMVKNMVETYKIMTCIVLPSYHEGMSNVLLEAAANGRPGIASNISGCKEIIEEGKTGFLVKKGEPEKLSDALEKFINLSHETKCEMGKAARKKVEQEFDRELIVNKYMNTIKVLLKC